MKMKKEQLQELMKQYVDSNNCIDISEFRKNHPNEYALLPHYFGGINEAIEQNGWINISKTNNKKGETVTLRNQLAYHMLKNLRKEKTLQQIADEFHCSRPAINQLYHALDAQINK